MGLSSTQNAGIPFKTFVFVLKTVEMKVLTHNKHRFRHNRARKKEIMNKIRAILPTYRFVSTMI